VTWSPKTERWRARYHELYGFAQGLSVAALLAWVFGWGELPERVSWGIVASSWVAIAAWRWSWSKFHASMDAELEKSRVELEALLQRFLR